MKLVWAIGLALALVGCAPPESAEIPWSCTGDNPAFQLPSRGTSARVIALQGEASDIGCAMQSYAAVLDELHALGIRRLVLPVGLYEGLVVDRRLQTGAPAEQAAETVYRVWRESPEFMALLDSLRRGEWRISGGLMRYHAAGKALFAEELAAKVPARSEEIRRLMGGTERLRDASRAGRDSVSALVAALMEESAGVQRQLLANYDAFVSLEGLRAEGESVQAWEERERRANLQWLLDEWSEGDRVVYWMGRGDSLAPPTTERVFRIVLRYD